MTGSKPVVMQGRVAKQWVIVAGGFHQLGGMDKANLALAEYLAASGRKVHVVTHRCEDRLRSVPNLFVQLVPRPAGSVLLGERLLELMALRLSRRLRRSDPETCIVSNGSSSRNGDINWVHYVHHAWNASSAVAGGLRRWKLEVENRSCRIREKRAFQKAELLIVNSERTRSDVINLVGISGDKVRTLYLGADPGWTPPTSRERAEARQWLGIPENRSLAVFVGALGEDRRKGFDTLFRAWKQLNMVGTWDVELAVAGSGRDFPFWRRAAADSGLADRIHFLGHTEKVQTLLAGADLLISPARYEPYGLNVQEAICRGVPAVVSASAGAAEEYGSETRALLLSDPNSAEELARTLLLWRADAEGWRQRFRPLSNRLRAHTWSEMARDFVELVEGARTPTPAFAEHA